MCGACGSTPHTPSLLPDYRLTVRPPEVDGRGAFISMHGVTGVDTMHAIAASDSRWRGLHCCGRGGGEAPQGFPSRLGYLQVNSNSTPGDLNVRLPEIWATAASVLYWPASAEHAAAASDRFRAASGLSVSHLAGPQAEHFERPKVGRANRPKKVSTDKPLNRRCLSATNC